MFPLTTDILIYALIGLIVILGVLLIRLELRVKKILGGSDKKNLEDTLMELHGNLKELERFRNESIDYYKSIESRLRKSIQGVETRRFNPFKGSGDGGNQSFSTAFVNERGEGVVLSSLYARDHVSVYAKPLKKFSSDFELTREEVAVVEEAKNTLPLASTKEKDAK